MKKRVPLYLKIIIGMALGLIWGLLAVKLDLGKITSDWIKPWGTVFLNLLKLIAVPLVFVSLVKGIYGLDNINRLRAMGFKTIGLYVATTVASIIIGLALVNTIKPGNTFPKGKQIEFQDQYSKNISEKQTAATEISNQSPLQFIVDMVPENIVKATTDNSKMLQIILFALLFGIAMILLPVKAIQPVKDFIDSLNEIVLKLIDIIMLAAPYGVFALLSALVVDFAGDLDVFTSLGLYFVTVLLGIFLILVVLYPIYLKIFVRKANIGKFFKGILPAQMVAFSTSSSAATLPVTMKQTTEELGVDHEVANFVLPVGVTINMNGTSCYQAIAAVFIAQVYGIDLTMGQQLIIVLTALLAAIGSPGVPGGSIVMLIIVLTSAGIPVEGLALILGVDRPLDMFRTIANITGDSATSVIVAKSEGLLDESKICRA
ncbi:MAG: glutamate:proton symporter [Bacteroidetes bacterium GWF2_49_14]|nr:MAG: glutamate:proton symporter [Bacteroidetes bacterium GWF2_49_14]HBB91215.1 dicarboxylate/amino acid:cation symporter [Bacteroidales bacterium]